MKKLILIFIISLFFCNIHPSERRITERELLEMREKTMIKKQENYIQILLATFRYKESRGNYYKEGRSGDYGAYQILRSNWNKWTKRYLKMKDVPMTPFYQDLLAHELMEYYISKGYSTKQIASLWNCGSPNYIGKIGVNKYGVKYDVPRYVKDFMKIFDKLNTQTIKI
jgi:hypothetical protein